METNKPTLNPLNLDILILACKPFTPSPPPPFLSKTPKSNRGRHEGHNTPVPSHRHGSSCIHVELGKLILHQYGHQFSITILLINGPFDPPAITSYVNAISQTHPSITFHTLPQRSVDTAPTRSRAAIAFEFLSLYGSDFFDYLKHLPDSSKPRAIVIDYFCASALPVAREFGIPVFHFFTSGAAVLGAYLYLPTMHEEINTTQSFKDLPDTLLRFPGFPLLPATQMPEPLLDRNDPAYDYIIYFSEHLRKSMVFWSILLKRLSQMRFNPCRWVVRPQRHNSAGLLRRTADSQSR
ncbi:UDP-glycosyltransferase 88F3 [Vitis vinifera]|uniref:UDP-glycosyltransferase 88F3 n=1 Tax=Vitis vinifera TaxID=29760 RepID=A0A438FFS7_VITVI|nr:UDP-glycosyltransferase 88F3 [Vitis vinifera]